MMRRAARLLALVPRSPCLRSHVPAHCSARICKATTALGRRGRSQQMAGFQRRQCLLGIGRRQCQLRPLPEGGLAAPEPRYPAWC